MDIFTDYMVKALGHANQKIVKDYATRSGEALELVGSTTAVVLDKTGTVTTG